MKAMARAQGKAAREAEKQRKLKIRRAKKAKQAKPINSMERKVVERKYPDEKYKPIIFHNVHDELRNRFRATCDKNNCSMVGKIRWFMARCIRGKIDEAKLFMDLAKLNEDSIGYEPDECPVIIFSVIPSSLHSEFKRWCSIRGYTMTGKLKQLMVAYIHGILEEKHDVRKTASKTTKSSNKNSRNRRS